MVRKSKGTPENADREEGSMQPVTKEPESKEEFHESARKSSRDSKKEKKNKHRDQN